MTNRLMIEAYLERVDQVAATVGLTRTQIAEQAPLPTDRLLRVLDGHAWPCPREQRAIATALGVLPQQLIPDPAEVG